jgi:cell division protein FtsN
VSKEPAVPGLGAVSDALKAPALAVPEARLARDVEPAAEKAAPATRAAKTKNAPASLVAMRTAPVRAPRPAATTRAVAKVQPVPLSREVVLQVGSYEDPRRAYALRNELRGSLDHVLVARVDQVRGAPLYSVRVVGLESYREIARAEDAIHALGHDSQRLSEPGPLKRLGRNWRPFLASLFGN